LKTIEFWIEYASTIETARIGFVAAREGWCREFTETAFRLHWTEGVLMPTPQNLAAAVQAAGHDLARVKALASSDEVREAFRLQSTRALERGIFGAPSFVVDGELFWGDDRLEAALQRVVG